MFLSESRSLMDLGDVSGGGGVWNPSYAVCASQTRISRSLEDLTLYYCLKLCHATFVSFILQVVLHRVLNE